MLNKDQSQSVDGGGIAIQAGGNVVVGVSADEARNIAMDVAKLTFYELTGVARQTMSDRVEEITDKVISKLEKEYPEGLKKAEDPDFQHALFTVQKNYGKTGDVSLGDLLVDLLVDRSKQDRRDLLQIVLNESLEVAPKLTNSQVSNLTLMFLFRYTQNFTVVNHNRLGAHFDSHVLPLMKDLVTSNASFQHLQFTGCGSDNPMTSVKLEDALLQPYPALFSDGFDHALLDERGVPDNLRSTFFIRCMNNKDKAQASPLNEKVLEAMLLDSSVEAGDKDKIRGLYAMGRMSPESAREKCIEVRPYMRDVFSIWNDSSMKSFTLTSVGMAIGHANIKRLINPKFSELSTWIN